mmetsp:Transcript_2107/g.3880  ORF Transcript_2107/g.3880 Transcript_2107/m.3880 type:complete len:201 (-) Transcript_2107:558-1160(-)
MGGTATANAIPLRATLDTVRPVGVPTCPIVIRAISTDSIHTDRSISADIDSFTAGCATRDWGNNASSANTAVVSLTNIYADLTNSPSRNVRNAFSADAAVSPRANVRANVTKSSARNDTSPTDAAVSPRANVRARVTNSSARNYRRDDTSPTDTAIATFANIYTSLTTSSSLSLRWRSRFDRGITTPINTPVSTCTYINS